MTTNGGDQSRLPFSGTKVYSGNMGMPDRAGGLDPTPENVSLPKRGITASAYPWWSIMKHGTAFDTTDIGHPGLIPLLHFSIEELSTVDLKEVPSREP